MSFGMSSRFQESKDCASPPFYKLPSNFDENASNNCSAWVKSIHQNKCDDHVFARLSNRSYKEMHEDFVKKHLDLSTNIDQAKRMSLSKVPHVDQCKEKMKTKRRLSLQTEEKENCCPQAPSSSGIPLFKKPPTVGQAPSFVLNPRPVHSCIDKDPPTKTKNPFDRHALQRKSIKPIKKSAHPSNDSFEPTLRPIKSKSYTVLPQQDHQMFGQSEDELALPQKCDNVTDDSKSEMNRCVLKKDKLLKKDEELNRTLTPRKLKMREVFALSDCNMLFLINEEFIDDEYDSYVTGLNQAVGELQVLQNTELYEMTRNLVRFYLEKRKTVDVRTKTMKKGTKQRRSGKQAGKLITKSKNSKMTVAFWSRIEEIVKVAIMELKRDFKIDILERTNQKVDRLVAELKREVLKTNQDIDESCERVTTNLIGRLESLALKC